MSTLFKNWARHQITMKIAAHQKKARGSARRPRQPPRPETKSKDAGFTLSMASVELENLLVLPESETAPRRARSRTASLPSFPPPGLQHPTRGRSPTPEPEESLTHKKDAVERWLTSGESLSNYRSGSGADEGGWEYDEQGYLTQMRSSDAGILMGFEDLVPFPILVQAKTWL